MAVVRFAGAFVASVLAAVFFVAADEDFFASVLAAVFLVAVEPVASFVAVVFLAVVDCLAGAFLASVLAAVFFVAADEDFFASVLAAVFLVAVEPAVFLAAAGRVAAARFAGAALVALLAALTAVFVAILGSFLAPDTTALKSAPARNFGTAVFLARVRTPVRGLRTIREGRTAFSNAPKPVMATFSPLATSRVIVSRMDSRAC